MRSCAVPPDRATSLHRPFREGWRCRNDNRDATPVNTRNLITIVSMMVLVGTEVFAVAIAAGWALAGIFELGDTVGHALMVVFSLFAAWAMLQLWRRATSIEPLRAGPAASRR